MATSAAPTAESGSAPSRTSAPLLEAGDRLSREEFERRYERMPHLKKAELIEGTVYMPSPTRCTLHAEPQAQLAAWLVVYASETTGVKCGDNSTVRLDLDNEPQPDLVLLKLPAQAGQARISADDYIEGAPELVVEIVASSRAYDLHQKKAPTAATASANTWRGSPASSGWSGGCYTRGSIKRLIPAAGGLLHSAVFPGLWLDPAALLRGDMKEVLAALRRGLDSLEHRAFVAQ